MDSVGQISPGDPHGGSPGKDQQAAGVGILLQIMMLVLSFILGHVLRRHRFYYLPEASASLLIGLIVGGLANISNTETSIRAWFNFHEEFFFLFLLPPIIFQSGFSLAPKPFFSNFGAIVTFAILGTFIAAIVTGLLVYLGGVMYLMYRLPLVECLMFGALISATDPVTVLSIFQELGTDMSLYALVFGESVLNDAMAISLYRTMSLVKSNSSGQNFFLIIVRFLETFVGSMSAGVGVGFTSALLFKYAGLDIDNLQNLECCLFVLFPYFSYMLAEGLGLSGIVSILFTGMVMKHYSFSNLSENSQKFVAAFFHLISSLAETFVFIYMGFDIAMEQHSWSHIGFIFFSIIFIGLARAANVFTCGYLLNLVRPAQRQIPVTHQKALWYSGLRGAMAFALALQSAHDLPEGHGQTIFTATTAIVVLTEELTKAMKAKEAREKKKAKLVEDIHSHMTELQSLLKQENTLVERKQSMENKKKIVENLMAGLQHVLTTNKLTLLIFFTAALTLLTTMVNPQATPTCKPTDHGPVVPTTPLVIFLETIQQTALKTFGPKHFDPKVYVDLSLKFDLPKVRQGFTDLPRAANGSVSVSDFNGFLEKFMNGVHEDLVYIEPVDFVVEPEGFLKKVVNENVREWGLEVHSLWKSLSRKVSNRVLENPELFTLLPLKYPVIIPGSRFQEVYYWDSYWVIRGLLVSKMYETAKGIVFNLIDLIDTYGYVLNGARAYYTNRSQPPLLSSMVIEVYKRTKDIELVKKALPALIKEHKFWNLGIHNVIIEDAQGARHNLSRYYAMWNQPRPESFTIDTETADKLTNDCEKEQLYRELATTAETGWDFSTRWMRDTFDLTTLSTTMIVPVDLNAFVLKMELDIAFLANVVAESHHVTHFHRASKARKKAMDTVFWNEEKGQWFDYWLNDSSKSMDVYKFDASYQNQDIFASNFIPLWVESFNSDETVVKKVTQSLQSSGLVRAAGIATSLTNSSQQWDFPNGWAPVQHMIVEGLVRSGSKEARSLAKDIAIRWIRTNYVTYKTSKAMHEKYDVSKCGEFGGGGEYVPQTGFGWSNGVALAFLEEFGWAEDLSPYCQ